MHDHASPGKSPVAGAGARYQTRLLAAFALISAFFLVEVAGGLISGSLALLSDAAHMFTDVIGLGMALAAIRVASAAARNPRHTFGRYRVEVLAAAANALLLFGIGVYILWEAYERFRNPPEVLSGPMLWIALAGLLANLLAFLLLREGAKESLNVQAAFLEVVADTLGSVGVIAAALIISFTGWTYADPLIAAAIGLFVLPRTARIGGQALGILMQHAPRDLDTQRLAERLRAIPGVVDLHDLHVWTLTSGMNVASAHLEVGVGASAPEVLQAAQSTLREDFSITHATIQIETEGESCNGAAW